MSAHTPGPWLDWETLEWLVEPKHLLSNTEDARLIAAAPDLLAMLKHAVHWHDQLTPADIARYSAAIAKADGRS